MLVYAGLLYVIVCWGLNVVLVKSAIAGIAAARVLEASTSGLCLSVPFRLPLHTQIEVSLEGRSVVGHIRNCVCIRANEFQIGVEIFPEASPDPWGLRQFRLLEKARAAKLFSITREPARFWASAL